jgi:hypothetical protein
MARKSSVASMGATVPFMTLGLLEILMKPAWVNGQVRKSISAFLRNQLVVIS